MSALPVLHGFWRSSASWRVRIALALKGIAYEQRFYRLREGEQRAESYRALNPQGLVPALEIDGMVLTQSLAICEYLEETRPEPTLLGTTPLERSRVRAFAQAIACDIHPVQNLKILKRVQALGHDQATAEAWARDVITEGLAACAALLDGQETAFCFGDMPTLADICLVPQLYNARRFGVEIAWPALARIDRHCLSLPAFADTAPERQPDAA